MTIVSGTYCLPMGGKGTSGNLKIEVVSALPETGRVDRVYFVPIEGATGNNQYTEYIWDKDRQRFEEVGPREIDLTPYATKEALNAVDNRLVAAEAEIVAVQGDVASLDADVATKQDALSAGSAIKIKDNTVGVAVFDKSKFEVVGSPVISADGVASGFSSSAYLTLPIIFQPSNKKWEIDFKITPNSINTHNDFFGSSSGTDYKHIGLGVSTSGKFALFLSSNGTSWDIASSRGGVTSIETGTLYYLKLIYDLTSYKLYSSTNNIDWITEISIDNSNAIYQNTAVQSLGVNKVSSSNYYPFTGSIDLNAFKIYIGGEQVLSGTKTLYQALDAKQDVLIAGNNITIEDGVISATGGGSGDAYTKTETDSLLSTKQNVLVAETPLKIYVDDGAAYRVTAVNGNINTADNTFTGTQTGYLSAKEQDLGFTLANYDTWEFRTKIRFATNSTTTEQSVFGTGTVSTAFNIYGNNQLKWYLSSNGSDWNMALYSDTVSFSTNTIYYIRLRFTGTQYIMERSTTNFDSMNTIASKSTSTKIYSAPVTNLTFIQASPAYGSTIFLEDTCFIGNGEVIWKAYDESKIGELKIATTPATSTSLGVVQPDGTTITADDAGVISAVNAVQSETIRNIAVMTQAEYDALETKDESTFYLIREETA